jgi:hypothetical protein
MIKFEADGRLAFRRRHSSSRRRRAGALLGLDSHFAGGGYLLATLFLALGGVTPYRRDRHARIAAALPNER